VENHQAGKPGKFVNSAKTDILQCRSAAQSATSLWQFSDFIFHHMGHGFTVVLLRVFTSQRPFAGCLTSCTLYCNLGTHAVKVGLLQWNGLLAGLHASQLNRLQSILHTELQLIYSTCWRDHVSPLLQVHWVSVVESTAFKLHVIVYHCLLAYSASDFTCVTDITALCSASTTNVVVPSTWRSTLGIRYSLLQPHGARMQHCLTLSLSCLCRHFTGG